MPSGHRYLYAVKNVSWKDSCIRAVYRTGELVEKPVRGRAKALLMLLSITRRQQICSV